MPARARPAPAAPAASAAATKIIRISGNAAAPPHIAAGDGNAPGAVPPAGVMGNGATTAAHIPAPPSAAPSASAETADSSAPTRRYDYILVVGPGRSGSDLLYRMLRQNPHFAFPEIKEGYYYHRPAKAVAALSRRAGNEKILADVANLAYKCPKLAPGTAALMDSGCRILLVVLLRPHAARAISMMRFRKSRGEPSALFGKRRLEAAVLRDRLTAERLAAIHSIGADALTLRFSALTARPAATIAALAEVCGVPASDGHSPSADIGAADGAGADIGAPSAGAAGAVNPSVRARNIWLSALGKTAAAGMRRAGMRRALQSVKDSPAVNRLFFAPLPPDAPPPRLSPDAKRLLAAAEAECGAYIAARVQPIADGVYFARGQG